MIEAAESLFLEQGYDATSLAAVVKRSGGSLATLYELFGNKQGLLRAIIELRDEQDLLSRLRCRLRDQAPERNAARLCPAALCPRYQSRARSR